MKNKFFAAVLTILMACTLILSLSACFLVKPPEQTDDGKLSIQQWSDAFELENVTIKLYMQEEEGESLIITYKLDNDKLLVDFAGNEVKQNDFAQHLRDQYNFALLYSQVTYENGKYYVETFDVFGDGSYVYNDVCLTFENAKIKSITAEITEWVDTTENYITNDFKVLFEDYGSTVAEVFMGDYTEENWLQLFNMENFSNVTYDCSGIGSAIVCRFDGMTKIIVGKEEAYYINNVWYGYNVETKEHWLLDEEDIMRYETSYIDTFSSYVTSISELYSVFKYDAENDEYSYNIFGSFMKAKIEENKLVKLVSGNTSLPDWDISFALYDHGTTSFEIPFEI